MKRPHSFKPELSNTIGIGWPPVQKGVVGALAALVHTLEETQWMPLEMITQLQHQQLIKVVAHANRVSPYFRSRMQAAGLRSEQMATAAGLRSLPVLTRRDIQTAGEALFCQQLPKSHLPIGETRTSGSSGEPVVIKRTAITHLCWMAANMREQLWHQRDTRGTIAVLRANFPEDEAPVVQENWGIPVSYYFETGLLYSLRINTDINRQVDWLMQVDPDYLLTYPTNLAALLQEFERRGTRLARLKQLRTIGETLNGNLHEEARRILGVTIADTYSSQELGVIAMQCPESGLYHTVPELHIVEVLDERGEPCQPGQVGRVVVTDLHNFATPLIRYQIGDYAEVGAACSCGRGLPTLQRVAGRERNMLLLPDGRRHWPLVGFVQYRDVAPIRQYQLIQRDLASIEMRLVVDSPLSAEQEKKLGELVCSALGFEFQLCYVYYQMFGSKPPALAGEVDFELC